MNPRTIDMRTRPVIVPELQMPVGDPLPRDPQCVARPGSEVQLARIPLPPQDVVQAVHPRHEEIHWGSGASLAAPRFQACGPNAPEVRAHDDGQYGDQSDAYPQHP